MQISKELFDSLVNIYFAIILLGFFGFGPIWLILTIFTPKKILKKYLTSPYFNESEIDLLRSFPISLLRTGIFGWVTLFPFLDKKRGIKDCRKMMPKWYKILIIIWCLMAIILFLVLTLGTFFLINTTAPN